MKILQIASKFPYPPTDGGRISAYGVTKYLSKIGHKIDFVAYLNNDSKEMFYSKMNEICTPHIINFKTDNSKLGALRNLFSSIPYNISKYYSEELKRWLKNYFKSNKPDIIHITTLHMAWCVDYIKEFTSVPVILREENLEMEIMRRFSENEKNYFLKIYSYLQYKKLHKYEPEMCEKFDCCVMISNKDKEMLERFNRQNYIKAIPVGIESELLSKKKSIEENHSLAHIGTMDWYPNYDSLSWFINDVLPDLVEQFPELKLYIYGGGKSKLNIPKALKDNIIVKGYVDDLWQELLAKNLAIVPLRIGGGIRVKILEMLAAGQNVISTSIGSEGIDVKDETHILLANNKDEFIEKITYFLNGKYDSKTIAVNGRNFIKENYTWEKIADSFDELYNELCRKSNEK